MSQRTFIEINHDLFRAVKDRPHQFVALLEATVLHRHDVSAAETLRLDFGVRRLDQHHHSDAVTIFVNGHVVWEEGLTRDRQVAGNSLIDKLRKLAFTADRWLCGIKLTREDRDRMVAALEKDGHK